MLYHRQANSTYICAYLCDRAPNDLYLFSSSFSLGHFNWNAVDTSYMADCPPKRRESPVDPSVLRVIAPTIVIGIKLVLSPFVGCWSIISYLKIQSGGASGQQGWDDSLGVSRCRWTLQFSARVQRKWWKLRSLWFSQFFAIWSYN